MFKKIRKKDDYNWIGIYIRDYNNMVAHYEDIVRGKNDRIKELEDEIKRLKSCGILKPRQKQISDRDIDKIKELKKEGRSYSYISKETGWSKATISRVINDKR